MGFKLLQSMVIVRWHNRQIVIRDLEEVGVLDF